MLKFTDEFEILEAEIINHALDTFTETDNLNQEINMEQFNLKINEEYPVDDYETIFYELNMRSFNDSEGSAIIESYKINGGRIAFSLNKALQNFTKKDIKALQKTIEVRKLPFLEFLYNHKRILGLEMTNAELTKELQENQEEYWDRYRDKYLYVCKRMSLQSEDWGRTISKIT